MKGILLFCILLAFSSCNYFEKKKVYTEDLLQEELQTFNWNDVDEYPTFSSCDTAPDKEQKRHCFENTLLAILNTNLSKQNIVVSEEVNDTIVLKIIIDNQGNFNIDDIQIHASTKEQIPEIDSLLIHSFDSLPKIYPAIKRSQQVTTQFSLPVVVKIDEITN